MKPKNKNLFFILFTVVILSSIIIIKEVEATQVIILKPTEGQQFNGLNYGDSIVFRFDIYGYYEWYKTYIDGQLDQCLHQQGEDIYYDAKSFIDKYGRGTHTFDVSVSTGGPGPLGVTGFEIESVTFTVNPPLCHFLGFGYDTQDDVWRSNVLPLQDLLREEGYAKYIPDYSYATFSSWSEDTVEDKIDELDTYEVSQDVVVVLFSSHGSRWSGISCPQGSGDNEWVTPRELKGFLGCLESNKLIVIVSMCHSGVFINKLSQLTNEHHIMTSCKANEDSYFFPGDYDPSWPIQTKIALVGNWFLGYLYQEFLDGESTSTAFSNAYTLTVQLAQARQREMHPQQHSTLTQLLYLCL
ncbi:MAG: C13 family peptidase [Candidatus Heimdallarchaeaceae archaeon]